MGPRIDMKATGQNIKALIRQRGYTVREIQQYFGFTYPQSVYHWFDGRNLPTVDNLYALSELLQVSMDQLIVGTRMNMESSGESSHTPGDVASQSASGSLHKAGITGIIQFAFSLKAGNRGSIAIYPEETFTGDTIRQRRYIQCYAEKLGSLSLAA